MDSSNPAFKAYYRNNAPQQTAPSAEYLQQMYNQPAYAPPTATRRITLDDVVAKTATVLGTAVIAGGLTAYFNAYVLMIPALIVGLVLSLVVIFKQSTNPALILSYAAAEGVVLGGITGWFEQIYPGIAMQAIVGTLGVFAGMLVIYKTRVIRVTPRFTKMLLGAMIGVVILMVFNLVASMVFGFNTGLRDGGTFAVIFSIICIVIAAMSLLLDFDQIEKAITIGAPEKSAWYFAFGLMVTMVWLYLEILRLLAYARN